MAEDQRRQFLALVQRNPGQAMLIFSRISTRQSTCWVLNDQLRIHSLIESSVGFETVDKQVQEAIAKALYPADSITYTAITPSSIEKEPLFVTVRNEEKRASLVKWLLDGGMLDEKEFPRKIEEVTVVLK
jgi:hypothetical protein